MNINYELIARMLADYMWPDKIAGRAYRVEAIQKQIDALNAADAAGVRTVNTTGPVREVIRDLRHSAKVDDYEPQHIRFLESVADRLQATLAPQPEAPAQEAPYAWATPGGDVSRSWFWCNERCLPGQKLRPLVYGDTASQPAIPERVIRPNCERMTDFPQEPDHG